MTDRRQPAEGVTRERVEECRQKMAQAFANSGRKSLQRDVQLLCDLAIRGLQGPSERELTALRSEVERLRELAYAAGVAAGQERIRAEAASALAAQRGEELEKAIELLEACRSCDLVYQWTAAHGIGDWEDQTTVSQKVEAFFAAMKESAK